jgi:hypothetical protein
MKGMQDARARLIWPVLFDCAVIAVCIVFTVRTGNWGYLLIAAGLAVLTVIWFLKPIPLDSPLSVTRSMRAQKWNPMSLAVVAGILLTAVGSYVAFT